MWWRGLDNKGFLLATNSLQLQKYQRGGQAGLETSSCQLLTGLLSGALPGLWEVEGEISQW